VTPIPGICGARQDGAEPFITCEKPVHPPEEDHECVVVVTWPAGVKDGAR
jgi:hypothetical protein